MSTGYVALLRMLSSNQEFIILERQNGTFFNIILVVSQWSIIDHNSFFLLYTHVNFNSTRVHTPLFA